MSLPKKLDLLLNLTGSSGNPVNLTTGSDNNGDGNLTDRPSFSARAAAIQTVFGPLNPAAINGNLARNVGTNPPTITLDAALNRKFEFSRGQRSEKLRTMTLSIRASNLLNHTNVLGLSGVVGSPFFYQPNASAAPRRMEAGVRFSF